MFVQNSLAVKLNVFEKSNYAFYIPNMICGFDFSNPSKIVKFSSLYINPVYDYVQRWFNVLNCDFHFQNSNPSLSAYRYRGFNYLNFIVGHYMRQSVNPVVSIPQPYTVFMSAGEVLPYQQHVYWTSYPYDVVFMWLTIAAGGVSVWAGANLSSNRNVFGNAIWCCVVDGANSEIWCNGVLMNSGNAGNNTLNAFCLGYWTLASSLIGQFNAYDLYAYNRHCSADEIKTMSAYLNSMHKFY